MDKFRVKGAPKSHEEKRKQDDQRLADAIEEELETNESKLSKALEWKDVEAMWKWWSAAVGGWWRRLWCDRGRCGFWRRRGDLPCRLAPPLLRRSCCAAIVPAFLVRSLGSLAKHVV